MSRSKQRDEWLRWSQLLCLVYNRTRFDKADEPLRPLQVIPEHLVTQDDRDAERAAKERGVMKVPFDVIRQIVLGSQHGSK